MNNLRMFRTRLDNRERSPRSRTDLNGAGRPHRNLRIRRSRACGGSVGVLPRTRRRSVHDSRNLSRAPAASLCDRLRRPLTEPVCRQVRQLSGSGEGPGQNRALSRRRGDLGDGDQDQPTADIHGGLSPFLRSVRPNSPGARTTGSRRAGPPRRWRRLCRRAL
jgi:hypothetical protein